MIKNSVKPPLEGNCVHKYASVQTIAYSSKDVNSVFSPIYRVLFERSLSVLDDRIMILTGLSNAEFETKVNDRLNTLIWNMGVQIENDMSKYDKSQLRAVLEFECMLLGNLGLSEYIVDIWYTSHEFSTMKDRTNGFRFDVQYQRRSGGPWTFPGNTTVVLALLLSVFGIDNIELFLVAGDDSFVLLSIGVRADKSGILADLFNMECKLLQKYEIPYFCSKFLIEVDGWVYFVPDILKIVTKFGRRDMNHYLHVEEYRISCMDMILSLDPSSRAPMIEYMRKRRSTVIYSPPG